MPTTQLLIDNGTGKGYQSADLTDDIKISLQKLVEEARNPTKKTGSFSQDFTLPFTHANRVLFRFEDSKQVLGKFKQKYKAMLVQDNQVLIVGYVLLLSNIRIASSKGFKIAIGADRTGSNLKIGDIIEADAKLTGIKSFAPLSFSGSSSVVDSWDTTNFFPSAEVTFAHVVRGFFELNPTLVNIPGTQRIVGGYPTTYEDLGLSHFTAAILKNIFTDAGYALAGDVLLNETFQKLMLLYSSTEPQRWNYGILAPMKAQVRAQPLGGGLVYEGGVQKTYNRNSDKVEVLCYPQRAYEGDLCESQGFDGVYTCKFTGKYSIRVSAKHGYQGYGTNGQTATGQGGFTVFRCISDQQFLPESQLPGSFTSVPDVSTLGFDTLAVGGDSAFTFNTTLVEGKQYQVQRYAQVSNPAQFGDSCYNPNETNFFITAVDGPMTVNPALFLPDMKVTDFLDAIFRIFNLYYQLNADTKIVTLYARDDFYQESLADIVDMNTYVSVDNMDDIPFTDAQIAATYLTYATDESDYILKQTDYLQKVNGAAIDGATELPFAPLGFMEVQLSDSSGHSNYDIVPAIIPASDVDGQELLVDENAVTAPGGWVPRLALYEDNKWLRNDLEGGFTGNTGNYYVALGRNYPGVPDPIFGFPTGGGYAYVKLPPKLSFFNVNNQPRYKITKDNTYRTFSVSGSTGATIYNPTDSNFLRDTTRVPEIDSTSLATNVDPVVNPRGFFYDLYANDILTGQLSYYVQGPIRMNPSLFTKLNGRQALAIDQDLYLLDSLVNYSIADGLATIKAYKAVINTTPQVPPPTSGGTSGGTGGGSTLRYSATKTATASCPTNTVGADVTATATRTSYVSQTAADTAAYNAALATATGQLVCTVNAWTETATAGAICPQEQSYGYGTQDTGTYTSTISQADALQHAQDLAYQNAVAKLVCHLAPLAPSYIGVSSLVSTVMGDFTSYPTSAAALAYDFHDYTYYYAPNSNIIFVGYPVYVQSGGYFYLLADGYYPFRYTIGNDSSTQWFLIRDGVVLDFVDNVGAGATSV